MIKIGQYGITFSFSRALWLQTGVPTEVKHFLFLWFFREARPEDIDKKPRFPTGTVMDYEGRRFYYYKMIKGTGEENKCQTSNHTTT